MATDTGLGSFEKGLDSLVNSLGKFVSPPCCKHQFSASTLVTHKALLPQFKLFTTEQMQWLFLVREQLIKKLTIDEDDFDNTPLLQGRGGAAKVRRVFAELASDETQRNHSGLILERKMNTNTIPVKPVRLATDWNPRLFYEMTIASACEAFDAPFSNHQFFLYHSWNKYRLLLGKVKPKTSQTTCHEQPINPAARNK